MINKKKGFLGKPPKKIFNQRKRTKFDKRYDVKEDNDIIKKYIGFDKDDKNYFTIEYNVNSENKIIRATVPNAKVEFSENRDYSLQDKIINKINSNYNKLKIFKVKQVKKINCIF